MIRKILSLFLCFVFLTPITVMAQQSTGVQISIPVTVNNGPADITVHMVSGEKEISDIVVQEVDGDKNISLGLPEIGEYIFEVKISSKDTAGYEYDKTVWKVKANLMQNEAGTEKFNEISIYKNSPSEKLPKIEFTNEVNVFPIEISKTDDKGEFVAGYKLAIKDVNGKIIDEWTTDKNAHVSKLPPGEYVLTEESIPAGYSGSGAVRFRVNADGTMEILGGNTNFTLKDGKLTMKAIALPNDGSTPKADTQNTKADTTVTGENANPSNTGDLLYGFISSIIGFISAILLIGMIRQREKQRRRSS